MFTTALALLFLVKLFLKTNFYAPKMVSFRMRLMMLKFSAKTPLDSWSMQFLLLYEFCRLGLLKKVFQLRNTLFPWSFYVVFFINSDPNLIQNHILALKVT